jgi:hypothetical protein
MSLHPRIISPNGAQQHAQLVYQIYKRKEPMDRKTLEKLTMGSNMCFHPVPRAVSEGVMTAYEARLRPTARCKYERILQMKRIHIRASFFLRKRLKTISKQTVLPHTHTKTISRDRTSAERWANLVPLNVVKLRTVGFILLSYIDHHM